MAAHASTRTTQLYDRREDRVTLDEVELSFVPSPKTTLKECVYIRGDGRSCQRKGGSNEKSKAKFFPSS